MADPTFAPEEQPQASIIKQPGIKVTTKTVRGQWETLEAAAKAAMVGFGLNSTADLFNGELTGRIATVQCVRTVGDLADYTVSVTEHDDVVIWGLDFMEIQKPIRAWHADKEDEKKPNLTQLRAWERLGENEATQEAYDRYVWQLDGGTSSKPEEILTGATLELAKMIREEGIETYALYTPIVTKTTVISDLSQLTGVGDNIGKVGAVDTSGGDPMGSFAIDSLLSGLNKQWLKTADRIQGAMDGTFQRVETWTGADKWNPNLYETTTGGSGGASGGGGNGGDSGDSGDGGGNGGGGLDIPDLPETPEL